MDKANEEKTGNTTEGGKMEEFTTKNEVVVDFNTTTQLNIVIY